MSGSYMVGPGDGHVLDVFGAMLTLKATSIETDGLFSLVEGVFQPGGFAPLPHIHVDREESFYVLDGEFDFRVGADVIRGEPGAFLHVPRGTFHGFANAGGIPARLLFAHTPALEGFFLELGMLAKSGTPEREQLAALMRRWAMEVPT